MRDFVKNKNGEFYLVSSVLTFDCGYETMIFHVDRDPEWIKEQGFNLHDFIDFTDLYVEHYKTEADMIKRHAEIVKKVENADIVHDEDYDEDFILID